MNGFNFSQRHHLDYLIYLVDEGGLDELINFQKQSLFKNIESAKPENVREREAYVSSIHGLNTFHGLAKDIVRRAKRNNMKGGE